MNWKSFLSFLSLGFFRISIVLFLSSFIAMTLLYWNQKQLSLPQEEMLSPQNIPQKESSERSWKNLIKEYLQWWGILPQKYSIGSLQEGKVSLYSDQSQELRWWLIIIEDNKEPLLYQSSSWKKTSPLRDPQSVSDWELLEDGIEFNQKDKSWEIIYSRYEGLLQGKAGFSSLYHLPSLDLFLEKLAVSLEITLPALLLAYGMALFSGWALSVLSFSWIEKFLFIFSSLPTLIISFLLYLLFSALGQSFLPELELSSAQKIGASLSLIFPMWAFNTVLVYQSFIRARRLPSYRFWLLQSHYPQRLRQHILLREALTPLLSNLRLHSGLLLSGSLIVERNFSIAGTAELLQNSFLHQDRSLILVSILFGTLLICLNNLFVDGLYQWLYPGRQKSF